MEFHSGLGDRKMVFLDQVASKSSCALIKAAYKVCMNVVSIFDHKLALHIFLASYLVMLNE